MFLVNSVFSGATVLSNGQQSLLGQHQIYQGTLGKYTLRILIQTAVPNLGKTKLALHHAKNMLNSGTDLRLVAIRV